MQKAARHKRAASKSSKRVQKGFAPEAGESSTGAERAAKAAWPETKTSDGTADGTAGTPQQAAALLAAQISGTTAQLGKPRRYKRQRGGRRRAGLPDPLPEATSGRG